uniref:Otopetrin-2 n=1 Tax=Macrostomum lignano TaxID=282301 RepID=A0A1I8ID31_9PLAT
LSRTDENSGGSGADLGGNRESAAAQNLLAISPTWARGAWRTTLTEAVRAGLAMKAAAAARDNSARFNQMAMLYAIFLTLFGLIFPLSSYVRAKPYSEWYLCAFYIILHSSAIAFLLFFMIWESERPGNAAAAAAAAGNSGGGRVEFRIGRFSVSESNHNFHGKEDGSRQCNQQQQNHQHSLKCNGATGHTQIELQEPEIAEHQRTTASGMSAGHSSQVGVTFDVQNSVTHGSNLDTIGRQKAYMKRINSTLIQNAKELGVHEIQAYSVLSLQESHSPSFFLRVACFIFGALKVTHDFLRIVDTLTELSNHCVGGGKAAVQLIQYALSIAFTVLQTFFIFKYSKVSVNIYHKVSVLGFMHLMATNMCVWFQAILLETGHNAHKNAAKVLHSYSSPTPAGSLLEHQLVGNYGDANGTNTSGLAAVVTATKAASLDHSVAAAANCSKEVFWRMAPYLFPFTIEYSLMAAFSCYVLYCNVGKFLDVIQTKGFNVGKKCLRNRKKAQTSFSASCYKSDKGFFLGALQMIVGIVSGIYFTIYINDQPEDLIVGKYIYLSTDLALLTLNLLLCIVAYKQMQALTLVQRMSTGPDAWLLGITLIGVLAFELFQLFGAFSEKGLFFALRLTQGIICIMQSLLQVFLVLDGEKRRSSTSEAIERKPGREMIAALLLGNLALWVVYTLEVREINNLPNYNDAYVLIASQIFSYVCSPLIIFFRFHSACCFVDIWRHAYKGRRSSGEQQQQIGDCDSPRASGVKAAGRYPGSANSLAVAREMSHM